jgi:protein-arginine kinase
MIYSSPRILIDNRNVSSKAYATEYKQKHAKEVIQKIKDAFAGSIQFLTPIQSPS